MRALWVQKPRSVGGEWPDVPAKIEVASLAGSPGASRQLAKVQRLQSNEYLWAIRYHRARCAAGVRSAHPDGRVHFSPFSDLDIRIRRSRNSCTR